MKSSSTQIARLARFIFFAITAVSVIPTAARAQGETTSAILGKATDSSNAVIAGATVTVSNRETGLKRSARRTTQAASISSS